MSRGAVGPPNRRPRHINSERVAQRVVAHRSSQSDCCRLPAKHTFKNAPLHAFLRLAMVGSWVSGLRTLTRPHGPVQASFCGEGIARPSPHGAQAIGQPQRVLYRTNHHFSQAPETAPGRTTSNPEGTMKRANVRRPSTSRGFRRSAASPSCAGAAESGSLSVRRRIMRENECYGAQTNR
jgi:hypothetical protein